MKEFKVDMVVNNTSYRFLFRALVCHHHAKYFVEVEGLVSARLFFEMKQDQFGHWKAIPPVPDWVKEIEPALASIIDKHGQLGQNHD
jgi:hypothetical protein